MALATRLRHVDVIVAGGSNTLLADTDDRLRLGDAPAYTYPLVFNSPIGEPVLVVNTAGDYRYLGRIVVDFDSRGRILQPQDISTSVNGVYATDRAAISSDRPPIPRVLTIVQALNAVLDDGARDRNILGYTTVLLEGRREKVRKEETNLGNLIADANLRLAQSVDPDVEVSLAAGGSIRAAIQIGAISERDIGNALPFNRGLVLLTLSAAEFITVLEHGVAASAPTSTPGAFPQIGGLRFAFDPRSPGVAWHDNQDCGNNVSFGTLSRLRDLVVAGNTGPDTVVRDGTLLGDPTRTFRVVTSTFLADGGDSYPYPCLSAPRRVDLAEVELDPGVATFTSPDTVQDALAEYLLQEFTVTPYDRFETPANTDSRIRNLDAWSQ